MKRWLFVVIGAIISLGYVGSAEADESFLKALQDTLAKLGNPWIAGSTSVSHLSWEEKQKLCGCIVPTPEELANDPVWKAHNMTGKVPRKNPPPPSLDWRDVDGHDWMTQPKNQDSPHACGSCYAFGTVGGLEARLKIVNNLPDDRYNPDLSEQTLVSCDPGNMGCNGGNLAASADFAVDIGIPDEACFPYVGRDASSGAPCENRCSDWQSRVVKPISWSWTDKVEEYKDAIMEGPTGAVGEFKEDFFYYKGGVYKPVMGEKLFYHGLCACGWSSGGAWRIKNSWGTGENQFQLIGAPLFLVWFVLGGVGVDYRFNEPNDGVWDPGESIDIITTLKSTGQTFTNVVGKLSTTDTDVTISDDTYNFGSIPDGDSADNTDIPFKATAKSSATEHTVEFKLHITAGGDYSQDVSLAIPIGIERFDYADIVASNATLTVTDVASIGCDKPGGNGSGFIYPANGSNTLYYASMAFGNSSSYLVDNWYVSGEQDNDWKTTTSPDGRMRWVSPPARGDTMSVCYYDDSGISGAKNVVCRQEAYAFRDNPSYDDFVILKFTYTNNGSSALTDLYSAVFADFDISSSGGSDNADINETKYLSYMSSGSVYVGITLLDPDKLANTSTINNATYVHPNNGMSDDDQYKFMNKTHHFGSQASSDYGIMVSTGKFDIAAGATQIAAFAIVGGKSKTEIETHADAARGAYVQGVLEDEDAKDITPRDVTLDVTPNLMLNTATITFSLSKASKVTIDIYDIAGRLCQNLVGTRYSASLFKAGTHTLKWNIKDKSLQRSLRPGVFFVRLKSANKTLIKKIILLK